ncbi:hypothetical protein BME96_18475 [Virgibacillus halodenitrificans]|uniref:Uncharacterized protein n=1 Tax=Virgibacillus halodenitrificans TaxID=1482 RepID=A0AAC9NMX0_VIRHA|nr:hypothetical protein [Virgibacillus halodenitrificans]APC50064.1 hypothetical protein BME96_18475 [Virgibacillus halodenitrificans]
MNSEKNAFDDETISKAKSVTKSYVQNNYKEVQSIELTEPYINPMGAMTIDGEAFEKTTYYSVHYVVTSCL